MDILVCSKCPPGGRCKLYIAYAHALAGVLATTARVAYAPAASAAEPPVLTVAGAVIEPEDVFLLTPEDVVAGLVRLRLAFDVETVLGCLRDVEARLMEG